MAVYLLPKLYLYLLICTCIHLSSIDFAFCFSIICLFIHLSVHPFFSVYPFFHVLPNVHSFFYPYLFIHLLIYKSANPSIYICIHLSFYSSICLFLYLSGCLPFIISFPGLNMYAAQQYSPTRFPFVLNPERTSPNMHLLRNLSP